MRIPRRLVAACTPGRAARKRYEQFLGAAEMIYGRLDEPQRATLRRDIERLGIDPQRILADRQRRQHDLLQTLRQLTQAGTSPEQARARLRAWFERVRHAPDPVRSQLAGRAREGRMPAVFRRAQQHQGGPARDAVRRLRAYQRDLRELVAAAR